MLGFRTLLGKEVLRFWKVSFQTLLAPVVSTLLYLLVFAQVMSARSEVWPGVSYREFLVPGLAMMAMLQNAFANSSSSLIQSKVSGNLVFMLLAPLSPLEIFAAYALAAMARGMAVGLAVWLVTLFFFPHVPAHPLEVLLFGLLGTLLTGVLGMLAGIWAEKFDQMAAFQNFLIMPLTFLAGVFYSIRALPPFWQSVSRFNPFLYMIDGFRHGFFGYSDVAPLESLAIVAGSAIALSCSALVLLSRGWRLRH
ncbi:MAG: ABC transporter permease [Pseudomonadota bacterium]|nr:ABC transporter permease [Pseudomonadota bacterium]